MDQKLRFAADHGDGDGVALRLATLGGCGCDGECRGERQVLVLDQLGGGRRRYGEADGEDEERTKGRHGLS